MKSLYSKKGAEQDPTRTKCLQWITPNLSTHCHLTQQDTAPTGSSALNAWGTGTAHPSQVPSENLSFPSMPGGMDTAKHRPCFGKTLGRVWQCWAPVLGITCTPAMCEAQRDKLKEKGELNKAQFPEIWAEKAVSHWRSTSTRMLLLMTDNCIQGLRLVRKTHRQFPRHLSNKKGFNKKNGEVISENKLQ